MPVPRWAVTALVLGLPVLLVAMAVVLSAAGLARGLGDWAASRGLTWVGLALGILALIDLLLLVVALGLDALKRSEQGEPGDRRPPGA
jgi:hypothetical protein